MKYISFLVVLGLFVLVRGANASGARTRVFLQSDHSTVTPGQQLLLGLRLVSEPGWHTYWKDPGETGLPTRLVWKGTTNATPASAESWHWPPPRTIVQSGVRAAVLGGESTIVIPLAISATAREGDKVELAGTVSWLECNDRSCVPQEANVALTLAVESAPVKTNTQFADAGQAPPDEVANPPPGGIGETESPKLSSASVWGEWTPERQQALLKAGRLVYVDFTARWCLTCQVNKRVYGDATLAAAFRENDVALLRADWTLKNPLITAELKKYRRGAIPVNVFLRDGHAPVLLDEMLTAAHVMAKLEEASGRRAARPGSSVRTPFPRLVLGFLGGLVLNFMPCVFPVLGLKVMGFVAQAGENRRRVVLHGLVFTGGVVSSFWVLAGALLLLRGGGAQLGWGFQLQEPVFVLALAVLLLVFALNMAGVFEVGGRMTGAGAGLVARPGLRSSFFSGVLATLVATPCAAPFLGVSLGAALVLPPAASLALFTAIALGLSAPYLLFAAVPALTRFLPRPGPWMESLKQGLSFLLFGSVLYLLWVLTAQMEAGLLEIFLGMVVVAFACWIYGRWGAPHRARHERILACLASVSLFAGACMWFYVSLSA